MSLAFSFNGCSTVFIHCLMHKIRHSVLALMLTVTAESLPSSTVQHWKDYGQNYQLL